MDEGVEQEALQSMAASSRKDLMQYQLDSQEIIQMVKANVLGWTAVEKPIKTESGETMMDSDGNVLYVQTYEGVQQGKQFMNYTGAQAITSRLQSILNKVTYLSTFTPENIEKICLDLDINLAKNIALKRREYEIDRADMDDVVNMVMHPVWAGLKRAEYGGEKEMLTTVRKTVEHLQEEVNGKDKGGGVKNVLPG